MGLASCIARDPMDRGLLSLHRSLKFILLASVAGMGWPSAASAQNNVPLPSIVVSPTQIPTPAEQVGSSVSVVTAAEIERDQRRTVPDVLKTIPGLNVVQVGGVGGQTSVFIRGTNSNHVKVLIDGIDVSDPSTPNRIFDFGHLQTYDIERIEVLRGPQSGLYGADAIGGVIVITTKKGEGPPKVRAQAEGGSFDTFNQAAGVSGSVSRFHYAFNVSHLFSGNTPITPPELLPFGRAAIGNRYENTTASTRLGADITENLSLDFVARYTDSNLRFTGTDFPPPAFIGVPSAQQTTGITHQFYTRGEARWALLDGRFINRFGAAYTDAWSSNSPPSGLNTSNQGTRDKYDWRGELALAPGHTLLMGVENETERLKTSGSSVRHSNSNTGAFAELQSQFADRFFIAANVRQDENESFGGHTTWRVAPAVILPVTETKLKGSYGTGFKAPSLSQLFVDFPPFFFANPNLRPEISQGFDVGFEQPVFGNVARFGVTYFDNEVQDLINCNTFCTTVINIDEARTYGTESFVAWSVTDRLNVRFDHTYTVAKNEKTGLELQRRPRNKFSFQTVWQPIDPLTLSTTVIWVSSWVDVDRQALDPAPIASGYTIVNFAANYRINQYATAFARIDNAFNERYQQPLGFLAPGIGVFGGIRVANRD
jgi:vitamin B12 transporter